MGSSWSPENRGKVTKARLGIEDERVQNSSWGGWWGLLRVAASSNLSIDTVPHLREAASPQVVVVRSSSR